MREFFIAGIKLYGVMSLFSGITACIALIQIWLSGPTPNGIMSSWLISVVLSAIIVFVSVTQAERLADLFGLTPGTTGRFSGFSAREVLRVGFILIGANQLLRTVPILLKELSSVADPMAASSTQSNVIVLIQVLVPIALIWGSSKVVKFVEDNAA